MAKATKWTHRDPRGIGRHPTISCRADRNLQSRVSQIDRGELEHTEVATLRSYFRELGGEVEVVVRLGDERLQIA